MDANQMLTARKRALGAFTALYVVLPFVITFVACGVTMWMATQERWKDMQGVAVIIGALAIPIAGVIAVTVFNRALGVWYARLRHAECWLGAAIGGVVIHLMLVVRLLSNANRVESAFDILKGLIG